MLLLDAAFTLAWLSTYEPDERRRSGDRVGVWAVRALVPFGQLTILLGTIATAAGPHAGEHKGHSCVASTSGARTRCAGWSTGTVRSLRVSASLPLACGSFFVARAATGARCGH